MGVSVRILKLDQVIEDGDGMLATGSQDTGKDGMGVGALAGTIAAIGFAGNDSWSEHAFGQIVGGFQVIDIEETQQMRAVFAQTFGETDILRVGKPAVGADQSIQSGFQVLAALEEGGWIQAGFVFLEFERFLQEAGELASEVQCSPGIVFLHVLQVFE